MSIEFFVGTDEDISEFNDVDELVGFTCRYNINATGARDLKDVQVIFEFFLPNADYVPKDIFKTIHLVCENKKCVFEVYKLNQKLIETVALFKHETLESPFAIEYWQSRNYFYQGIWNSFYGFYNLCLIAMKNNKNMYLFEERAI